MALSRFLIKRAPCKSALLTYETICYTRMRIMEAKNGQPDRLLGVNTGMGTVSGFLEGIQLVDRVSRVALSAAHLAQFETFPLPPPDSVPNGCIPHVQRAHTPIRQPKPQSGGKIGKRSQF